MTRPWLLPVFIAAVAALLVAGIGGTMTDTTGWYQTLRQPSWNPPPPAFAIIWTVIFSLIALAGVTAWRAAPNSRESDTLIGLFALNGALNIGWSILFFQLRRPDWAIIERRSGDRLCPPFASGGVDAAALSGLGNDRRRA